jgi:hypothetical protein
MAHSFLYSSLPLFLASFIPRFLYSSLPLFLASFIPRDSTHQRGRRYSSRFNASAGQALFLAIQRISGAGVAPVKNF